MGVGVGLGLGFGSLLLVERLVASEEGLGEAIPTLTPTLTLTHILTW